MSEKTKPQTGRAPDVLQILSGPRFDYLKLAARRLNGVLDRPPTEEECQRGWTEARLLDVRKYARAVDQAIRKRLLYRPREIWGGEGILSDWRIGPTVESSIIDALLEVELALSSLAAGQEAIQSLEAAAMPLSLDMRDRLHGWTNVRVRSVANEVARLIGNLKDGAFLLAEDMERWKQAVINTGARYGLQYYDLYPKRGVSSCRHKSFQNGTELSNIAVRQDGGNGVRATIDQEGRVWQVVLRLNYVLASLNDQDDVSSDSFIRLDREL